MKLPNSYRRITIASIVGKVVEKHMLKLSRPILDPAQSRLQFGFSKGISPIFAALVVTELMAEATDSNSQLQITFLDTSKAFDVVDHQSMLQSLHRQGVTGNLWQLYRSMYSDITSTVKWDGELSKVFPERQGIRQGGDSSADCYKSGKNALLAVLDEEPSARIGHIHAGAVMVADDLTIASHTSHDMQIALNIAARDSSMERYKFNAEKTKTIIINAKEQPHLTVNQQQIGISSKEVHLGISRRDDLSNCSTVEDRVRSARGTAFSLMGAGFHGLNGVGAEVAKVQYNTYVIPTLLYGLEALIVSDNELETLAKFHRKALRQLQHLPTSTGIPALYLMLGVPPVEALLHIRTLTFFRSAMAADAETPPAIYMQELLQRQLAVKDATSASWINHIKQLLRRYHLPSAYDITANPPPKKVWKDMVKRAVLDEWTADLQEQASLMPTLQHLNINQCSLTKTHPIWHDLSSEHHVMKATVKALLLVSRYPLSTSHTAGATILPECPMCEKEPEDTTHFVLGCEATMQARRPYLQRILTICREQGLSIDPQDLVAIILDSTWLRTPTPRFEEVCRNMLFKLHTIRAKFLGGGTGYKLAR